MSETRSRLGRLLFATVILGGWFSPSVSAQGVTPLGQVPRIVTPLGQVPRPETNRIQIDRWVDPANDIVNPLTEIVEMKNGSLTAGTGTFLPDCRVMTALHVLLGVTDRLDKERGVQKPGDQLDEGESLLGETFEFETRPSRGGGRRERGRFIVIGHGNMKGLGAVDDAMEDWAIGYDQGCLSDKLGLGHVKVLFGQQFALLKGGEFLTAGYSQLPPAEDKNGRFSLYIDSKCGVSDSVDENYTRHNYFITNCSVWHGGSGQLLLGPGRIKGEIVKRPNGQPQLLGYGIFQGGEINEEHPEIQVPNVKSAIGVAAFTDNFYVRLQPYLKGAFDLETALKLKKAAAALARGPAPSTALGSWTGRSLRISNRFSMSTAEWRILWTAVSFDPHMKSELTVDVYSATENGPAITTIQSGDIKGQVQGETVVRAPAGTFSLHMSGSNLLQWRVSVEGR